MFADRERRSFPAVDLTGASLYDTDLTGSDLSAVTSLNGANLGYTTLTNAILGGSTDFTGADFSDATWSNTTCPDSTNSDRDGFTCLGNGA